MTSNAQNPKKKNVRKRISKMPTQNASSKKHNLGDCQIGVTSGLIQNTAAEVKKLERQAIDNQLELDNVFEQPWEKNLFTGGVDSLRTNPPATMIVKSVDLMGGDPNSSESNVFTRNFFAYDNSKSQYLRNNTKEEEFLNWDGLKGLESDPKSLFVEKIEKNKRNICRLNNKKKCLVSTSFSNESDQKDKEKKDLQNSGYSEREMDITNLKELGGNQLIINPEFGEETRYDLKLPEARLAHHIKKRNFARNCVKNEILFQTKQLSY